MHKQGLHEGGAGQVERLRHGIGLLERCGPGTQEVDGIGQNQPGVGVQDASGQNIQDFVLRLLRHPIVDFQPHRIRFGGEVRLLDVGLVLIVGGMQKGRQKRETFLGPQCIGNVQLDGVGLLVRLKIRLESSEEGSKLLLVRPNPRTWDICCSVLPPAPAYNMARQVEML